MSKLYLFFAWLFINLIVVIIQYLFPSLSGPTLLNYHCWFNVVILFMVFLPKGSRLYFDKNK